MMDVIMIAVLAGSIGLVCLLIGWGQKELDRNEEGGNKMIILGIIVVLLGGYLVYALLHPDKF